MNTMISEVEDVEKAVMAGQAVRDHGPWAIALADESLAFERHTVDDPIVTGSQVLESAGVRDPIEYAVFRMLDSGILEGIRPNETTDIRTAKVARFLVFRTDRTYRLVIADQVNEWGVRFISAATLRALADEDASVEVWQDVRGGEADRRLDPHDFVDLDEEGVERFYFQSTAIHIVVNAERKTVHQRQVSHWDVVKLAFPDAVPSETIIYSVDYGKGPKENPQGSLAEGQHVAIKEGMTFYVTPTDKS
ncbi:MAG TPA: multiubiquitin domain-containing protein [Luteibacter sp.]|jgi:hypothetical protein|uniref:multiubiquitin domain-containing protein n=1 Tax=Luteibacter sp. TaxID=1886636 RepID=UPI002F42F716